MTLDENDKKRFWSKVDFHGGKHNGMASECWIWTCFQQYRYGLFRLSDKNHRAHRVALLLDGRPVPSNKVARHLCGNSLCVNPKHLTSGSQKQNIQDKYRHGTSQEGETHPMAKLTQAQVDTMRRLSAKGCSGAKLAIQFGVSHVEACRIIRGATWKRRASQ